MIRPPIAFLPSMGAVPNHGDVPGIFGRRSHGRTAAPTDDDAELDRNFDLWSPERQIAADKVIEANVSFDNFFNCLIFL
jgi:hypothetical protein